MTYLERIADLLVQHWDELPDGVSVGKLLKLMRLLQAGEFGLLDAEILDRLVARLHEHELAGKALRPRS